MHPEFSTSHKSFIFRSVVMFNKYIRRCFQFSKNSKTNGGGSVLATFNIKEKKQNYQTVQLNSPKFDASSQ